MKKTALIVGGLIIIAAAIAHWYFGDRGRLTTEAQYTNLERKVANNELVSERDPAVRLRLDPKYRYIGGQRFILYGVADTEQHFFVETNAQGRLDSFYWIQFEAYLPGKPYTYDYDDSPLRVTLGDFEFYTDAEPFHFDREKKRKRGTDGAMVREFLASKGLAYSEEVLYARLVYLTDEARNKELMIIYMDDLATQGLTAADLLEGGAKSSRWPDIEQALVQEISDTLTVIATSSETYETES